MKRHIRTWDNLSDRFEVDRKVNTYAEENNLSIVQVSLTAGVRYLHVTALFEEQSHTQQPNPSKEVV